MNKKLSKVLVLVSILALPLTGCDKLKSAFSSASSETQFFSSMEARWTDATNSTLLLKAVDGKMIGMDAQGAILVVTPTGKYDADNRMMPVKMQAFSPFDATADTTVKALSINFLDYACAADVTEDQRRRINDQFKFKEGNATTSLVGCLSLHVKREGLEKFKANVSPVVASLKQELVVPNLVLYNSAANAESIKVGLKKDDGTVIWNLGFVRKLNDDEANQLSAVIATLPQKIAERNAIIDKISADLVRFVEGEVAATPAKVSEQETGNAANGSEPVAPVTAENAQPKS